MKTRSLTVLINYCWLALALFLRLNSPVYAQGPEPKFSSAQVGTRTVFSVPANWTASATDAELALTSSSTVNMAISPGGWNAKAEGNVATFKMVEGLDKPQLFFIKTNSTHVSYQYELTLNGTKYTGKIKPETAKERWFTKWTDAKENAAAAFIPEGWSADLQIIRPYRSMTGFIFFARGSENTLVYIFQPFMPLHLFPSDSLCTSEQICSGTISAEKVKEMSLGNAPLSISYAKTPEQYFASEVLPILKRNLNSYSVLSEQSVHALTYGDNSTDFMAGFDVHYGFSVEGTRIQGREMIFTKNHTISDAGGIWSGFIVGVESSEKNFDTAMKQAAITLLTLKFDEKWLDKEQKVLLYNANETNQLDHITELMANSTSEDFDIILPTAAHKMVRTYNNTMIAGYLDKDTQREIDLPLFTDLQHWYLDGEQLLGTKAGTNLMNSTTLERLF